LQLLSVEKKPQVRQYVVKALGSIGDPSARTMLTTIARNEEELYYTRGAAQNALKKLRKEVKRTSATPSPAPTRPMEQVDSSIVTFLTSNRVQVLPGNWEKGVALDFHSRFIGSDWQRSQIGELMFRLKYHEDRSVLPHLAHHLRGALDDNPELATVDLIAPVPPSEKRPFEPVQLIAETVAEIVRKPIQVVFAKRKVTAPQKEMRSLAQKQANVAGVFTCTAPVQDKTILIVDDLFDSGATLTEITRLLKANGARCVYTLVITRTIHSDA
jgi:competence protein ComFC